MSMFRVKSVGLVGISSVGIGPIELKFGGDAGPEVPHVGKSESTCYSMFRAELVYMVGTSSVGISLIGQKSGGDAGSKVLHKGKTVRPLL
jgi:hypothetical protein